MGRASLVELGLGAVVLLGLIGVCDSLTKNLILPILGSLSLPDLSGLNVYGIQFGNVIRDVMLFGIRIAVLYLLIVFPLRRLAHGPDAE